MINKNSLFDSGFFLADGGFETTLIFRQGIELNHFAAFELLNNDVGKQALKDYYIPYLDLALRSGMQYVLETPTWRANPDWAYKLGYSHDQLKAINRNAVAFLRDIIREYNYDSQKILLSGCVGPRFDAYMAENSMEPLEAKFYHQDQVQAFALADVDVVTAMTLNHSNEAIGIVLAAKSFGVPAVISFTVETDGKLPNGESLKEAIENVDKETDRYAAHFMVNCAHPEHFRHILKEEGTWKNRIRGIRANASTMSHQELDESETLDTGDKDALAKGYLELQELLPDLRVVGGCCGTDHSHMEEICKMVDQRPRSPSR